MYISAKIADINIKTQIHINFCEKVHSKAMRLEIYRFNQQSLVILRV